MARARNIKPSFFTSEQVADNCPLGRLFFIGLWTEADHRGNLEWKPRTLKVKILPFDECDIEKIAINLDKSGLIRFYSVNNQTYINIPNFERHQNPHKNERDKGSSIPEFDETLREVIDFKELTINRDKNGTTHEENGSDRADSLFLIPDSPILNPESCIKNLPAVAEKKKRTPSASRNGPEETQLQEACRETWSAYSEAYLQRYGTSPIRNATVNSQIKAFCKKLPLDESPHVARAYLDNNDSFYVRKGHDVGLMVVDAAKLRTEWATGSKMTATKAIQLDKTSSMLDTVNKINQEMGW